MHDVILFTVFLRSSLTHRHTHIALYIYRLCMSKNVKGKYTCAVNVTIVLDWTENNFFMLINDNII